jgi:omega-amidase
MKLRVALVYEPAQLFNSQPASDVVVLPELMDGGYAALKRGEGIHSPGDPFLGRFQKLSRSSRATIIAGSVPTAGSHRRLTNSSFVYRGGRCVHRYDKIHLFQPGGELHYFRAGASNATFALGSGPQRLRGGVIICYDLRFPELARMLALEGLHVLFVPARWPIARDDAWQSLLKARAIENQMFVVGCNAKGKEGGFSYVFDPLGALVLSSREDPDALVHEVVLDTDRIKEAQTLHRNVRDAVLLRALRPRRRTGNSRLATVWIPPRIR